jgi:hypothetical protein
MIMMIRGRWWRMRRKRRSLEVRNFESQKCPRGIHCQATSVTNP